MPPNRNPGVQNGWCQGTVVNDGTLAVCVSPTPQQAINNVGAWSIAAKLGAAIKYAAQSIGGEAGAKLMALASPTSLIIIAGTLTAWVTAHAYGAGEAADVGIVIAGLIFLGLDAITAAKCFGRFAFGVVTAQTDADLRKAGDELAKAIAIVGVDAVLVWLTHGAGKAYKGRYQPTVEGDPAMDAGAGETDKYGNVRYSTKGSASDQALARYHEMVHSVLSPKLMRFREFRADLNMTAYQRSAFLRYLEEALAESYAQLRVNGIKGLPTGIKFPIANGYVTLSAVLLEGAIGTVVIGGITYYVYTQIDN